MKIRSGLTHSFKRALVTLFVTAACTESPTQPDPSASAIVVDMAELTMTAKKGAASEVQPATVTVTNGGQLPLTGLAVAVVYPAGQPDGWLEATLNTPQAPAMLRLQVRSDDLDIGRWNATVELRSPGARNSPTEVSVRLDVIAPDGPWVALSDQAVTLTARATEARPDPATIAVTNDGIGILGGFSYDVLYPAGEAPHPWLQGAWSDRRAPTTLELTARTDLPPGRYSADLVVRSHTAPNRPVISVTYDLLEPRPTIELEEGRVDWIVATGSGPLARSIAVRSSSGAELGGLSVTGITYGNHQPEGWLTASLASDSRVRFDADPSSMAAGLYHAHVELSSDDTYHPAIVTVRLSLDQGAPDFATEGALVTGASAEIGGRLDIGEFHVLNQGTGSGTLLAGFVLSTDEEVDESDIGGCGVFGTLEAGERRTIGPRNHPIPTTIEPGTYYLGFVMNCGGRTLETDQTNNVLVAATPITVTEAPPATLTARAEPAEGGRVVVSPVGPMYPAYSEVTLEAIPNPGYRFLRFRETYGHYTDSLVVRSVVLTHEFVAEFAALEELSDLTIVGSLRSGASTPAGQAVDISPVSVVNIGAAASGYIRHRYFLSLDRTITTDDIPIHVPDLEGTRPLEPGKSAIVDPGALPIPWWVTPGRYYVGLITGAYEDEPGEGALESDESNNSVVSEALLEVLEPLTHTLTINVDGVGGRVDVDPVRAEYPTGSSVRLTAVPEQGYEFVEWIGLDRTQEAAAITIRSDTTIVARFGIMTPTLEAGIVDGKVDVSWTFEWRCTVRTRSGCVVSPGDHFELEEATAHGGPYAVILTTEDTHATSYGRQFSRAPGTYFYRVRARGTDWASPYSWPQAVTVPDPGE